MISYWFAFYFSDIIVVSVQFQFVVSGKIWTSRKFFLIYFLLFISWFSAGHMVHKQKDTGPLQGLAPGTPPPVK